MTEQGICRRCNRPIAYPQQTRLDDPVGHNKLCKIDGLKFYLQFGAYGCDTGCTGHMLYIDDSEDNTILEKWVFDHPEDNSEESQKRFIEEMFNDWMWECGIAVENIEIDYENCNVFND